MPRDILVLPIIDFTCCYAHSGPVKKKRLRMKETNIQSFEGFMFFCFGEKFCQNVKNKIKGNILPPYIFWWKNCQISKKNFKLFSATLGLGFLFDINLNFKNILKKFKQVLKACHHWMLNHFWDANQWHNIKKNWSKSPVPCGNVKYSLVF